MSPHPAWQKRIHTAPRPWEFVETKPFSEVPDLTRGDQRLAAEVAIAMVEGTTPPEAVVKRAFDTLSKLAFA